MTMKVRGVLSLVVAAAAMWLTSCGHYTCGATFGNSSCSSTGGGISQGGNGSSGTVFAFLLVESNTAPVGMAADHLDLSTKVFTVEASFTPPPLPLSGGVFDGGTVVVSSTSTKYLYIPFSDSTLFGYAIDGKTGALTPVPNSPYIATGGTSIAADPTGRFLFVSDFASGDITVFTINANDGSLSPVAGSPFLSGIAAAQMSTDGQGKFLYVTEGLGGAHVAAFAVGQTTGVLTTVTGSPFAIDMAQVGGEKTGKFLLGISGIDSHIHVFGINSTTGAIAEVSGSPFATASAPLNFVVHPTGTFVYTFHSAGAAIEGFQIDPTSGALTAIAGSPFTVAMLDQGQFDQSGKFLFGVGAGNLAPTFGPYPTDPTTGIVSATTFELGGFPGAGFAISDLDDAP